MGKSARERVSNWFDTRGAAWQVPGLVVSLVFIGAAVGGWFLRDPLSDFLTADAKVWHLLLALGALMLSGLMVIMRLRSSRSVQPRVDRTRYAPKEIEKYDVLWPVTARWFEQPEFRAGKPQCRKCRTSLGLDSGDGEVPIQLPDDGWKDVPSAGMTFRCPKDGLAYDLTGYKTGMFLLARNVEAEAAGRYSTALREAGH